MPADFNTAIQQFEAGLHHDAAETCREILAGSPGDLSASNMLGVIAAAQGDFEEAAICFRACADGAPQDAGVAANLAQALLETGAHDDALSHFKRAVGLQGGSAERLRLLENTNIDIGKAAAGNPYVETLRDVSVDTGYWGILNGDEIYFRETANLNPRNSPLIKGRITSDLSTAVADLPPATITIDAPCILLGGDENYAHWLTRYLMRLALIENESAYSELPILTIDSLKPFQHDSLDMIGIDDNRLIKVPRHAMIQCREIVVATCLRTDTTGLRIGIDWLRRTYLPKILEHVEKTPRRLFVSRRDAPSRHMSNEEDVEAALSDFGFTAVRLGEHSFAEQVNLFANAEIVVAPHGAGLANMMFAPADCALVEIVSQPISNMNDFRLIAQVLGQPLTVVESASWELDPGAKNAAAQHNFTVDPALISEAVSELTA